MLINWFTVVAQIVNFLILVVLLKVFLYDRIVDAMDRRQQEIEDAYDKADRAQADARSEQQQLADQRRQLEEETNEILQQARDDADTRRQELIDQARSDVEDKRRQWVQSVQREKADFVADLRRRMGNRLCQASRRALSDLADVELEQQVVRAFNQRLTEIDDDRQSPLRDALADGRATVLTSWEMNDQQQSEIVDTLGRLTDETPEVDFQTDEGLICGLEVRTEGQAIGWSVQTYLDELAEQIQQQLDDLRRKDQPADNAQDNEPSEDDHVQPAQQNSEDDRDR
jgi:F-type H+-transporting ATPase subunit b